MNPTEEIHQKLSEFEVLNRMRNLTADSASVLAERAAQLVIEHHQNGDGCLREAVNLICEIATDQDSEIAQAGIKALFPSLVERLNDSFEPAACRLYDQLFAQVIEFCRRLPEGEKLNEGLNRFGLMNESDLVARKAKLQYGERERPSMQYGKRQRPESSAKDSLPDSRSLTLPVPLKVLLLSRVTIGADVAVTSAIIAKLRQAFPQAEFVILGSRKLRELYGGDSRIRIHEIAYERGGSLIARLTSWLDVVEAVNEERRGFANEDVWLIDPDSRLTQLGLLPLVENDHNYFFFESRSYQSGSESKSIGQLAANWSGELIGNSSPAFPFVALPDEYQQFGQRVAEAIRNPQSSIRNLTAVSFGVGGNHAKRVSAEFEQRLVERLLTDSKIILDKGATEEEREQVNRIVAAVRAEGKTVVEMNEASKAEIADVNLAQANIVTWDGGIGSFAGLIAASDKYIGYDSAGQHISAALGVPTLTVFVNSNNATFAERWRPFGKGKVEVLRIEVGKLKMAEPILDSAIELCRKIESVEILS